MGRGFKNLRPVDLSIDYDFFFYDDPMWDWAIRETKFHLLAMWAIREENAKMRGTSLQKLSTVDQADFSPLDLVNKLAEKGFLINSYTKVSVSESHGYQYSLSSKSKNNLVILDAHCDSWRGKEINCATWMRKLLLEKKISKAVNLLPGWQDLDRVIPIEAKSLKNLKVERWKDYKGSKVWVENIFLCRSGCWVPPHHDALFNKTFFRIYEKTRRVYRYGDEDALRERVIPKFEFNKSQVSSPISERFIDRADYIPLSPGRNNKIPAPGIGSGGIGKENNIPS